MLLPRLLLLLFCLRLGRGAHRTELPSPSSVWFKALLFDHILHWTPIPNQSPNTSYEVMLQRYGDTHWNLLPSCSQVLALSCDITMATLDLYHNNGYRAKVRAVDGPQLSNWTLASPRFTMDEVVLTVSSVTLEMYSGLIHGTIQLPRPQRAPEGSTYENIFPLFRKYKVAVLKPLGNYTMVVASEHFSFPAGEVGRLCVQVKPFIDSRMNKGIWSSEQCITLRRQYFTVTNVSLFFTFVLLLCVGLGYCSLHLYVRRRGKLPSALVFKQPSPFVLPSQLPCSELWDTIHPLDEEASLELRASGLHDSTDSSFGSNKPFLQMGVPPFMLSSPGSQAHETLGDEGLPELQDSCSNGSSTDSGICLQESGLHPGPPAAWEPQDESAGHRQDDSGVSLVQSSGDSGDAPNGSALGRTSLLGPEVPQEEDSAVVVFQGYLKQTRCTEELATTEGCLEKETFSTGDLSPRLSVCPEAEAGWLLPVPTKGYVKQCCPGTAGAPPEIPTEQWSQLVEEWPLLAFANCGDLETPGRSLTHDLATLDCKAALDHLSSCDSDSAPPLISSLYSNE